MVEASISSPEFHRVKISKKKNKTFRLSGGFPGPKILTHSFIPWRVPRSASSARPPCCICPVQGISPKSPSRAQRFGLGFCPLTIIDPQKRWDNEMGWSVWASHISHIQKWMVKTSRSPRPSVLDDSDEGTYLTLFGINLIVGLDFS